MGSTLSVNNDGSLDFSIKEIGDFLIKIFFRIFRRHRAECDFIDDIKKNNISEAIEKMKDESALSYLELSKCKNFIDIAKMADDYLTSSDFGYVKKTSNKKPISETFAIRMFELSSNCYDDQIKQVWARLMADAVINSGNFHLKTLDILNVMSSDDLHEFNRFVEICMFTDNDAICINDNDYIESNKISISGLRYFEELGLISMNGFLQTIYTVFPGGYLVIPGKNLAFFAKNNSNEMVRIEISNYPLSTSGFEIAKLYKKSTNDSVIKFLCRYVDSKNLPLEISCFPIIQEQKDGVILNHENPINFENS